MFGKLFRIILAFERFQAEVFSTYQWANKQSTNSRQEGSMKKLGYSMSEDVRSTLIEIHDFICRSDL